jgi:hypothetical protein
MHRIFNRFLTDCYLLSDIFIVIISGSAAQRGLWPPRSLGYLITHIGAPQSVGHLLDE